MKPAPLQEVYVALYRHFGPQGWWPGRTRIEVCVGAILTQNTSWANVEKGLRRIRREGALSFAALQATPVEVLGEWLRPVGYYNLKAKRLKAFLAMVEDDHSGSLNKLFALPVPLLRKVLLSVRGIGPETADCMMLYAAKKPVFVVDAYTRRFLGRHHWLSAGASYDEVAGLFTEVLPHNVALFNEYHALIVALAKDFCRARPACRGCPLEGFLPAGGPATD